MNQRVVPSIVALKRSRNQHPIVVREHNLIVLCLPTMTIHPSTVNSSTPSHHHQALVAHLPLSRHRIQGCRPIIHGIIPETDASGARARKVNQGWRTYDGIGAGEDETLGGFYGQPDRELRLVEEIS
jgi:hypothetical protein